MRAFMYITASDLDMLEVLVHRHKCIMNIGMVFGNGICIYYITRQ